MSISVLNAFSTIAINLNKINAMSDECVLIYNKICANLSAKENVSIYERYFMYRLVNSFLATRSVYGSPLLSNILEQKTSRGAELHETTFLSFLLYIQTNDEFSLHDMLADENSEYKLFVNNFSESSYLYLDVSDCENLFQCYDFDQESGPEDRLNEQKRRNFFTNIYAQLSNLIVLPRQNHLNKISSDTFSFHSKGLLETLPAPVPQVSFSDLFATSYFGLCIPESYTQGNYLKAGFHLSREVKERLPRRLPAVSVSAFSSGSNPSTFALKAVTHKQAHNAGSFTFFSVAYKNLNSDLPNTVNLVSLVSFKNISDLKKYSKARKNMNKLNRYLSDDALYFVDNAAYQKHYQEKFKKLSVYSSNWAEYLATNNHLDEEVAAALDIKTNSQDSFDSKSANAFFSSFDIEDEPKQLTKAKKTLAKLLKDQLDTLLAKNNTLRPIIWNVQTLVNSNINTLTNRLANVSHFEKLVESCQKYPNLTQEAREAKETFISNVATNYISLASERENYLSNIDYNTAQLNESNLFTNLNNTYGIEFYSITYEVDSEQIVIKANSEEDPSPAISSMLVAKQINPSFRYKSIKFATNGPVKILPNGNESKAIAGGPYVIEVTQRNQGNSVNLYLMLKDNASIFGFNGTAFYAHPHAGSGNFNMNTLQERTFSACLGESSSYIFKAFAKNDLTSILVNTFLWLKSANGADTWGKNYKHFPKWSDLIIEPQEQEESIDLKDVIAKSIVSEETTSDSNLDSLPAEPVYRPQEPVFLQEQPAVRPVSETTISETISSVQPVTTYTPYVRT